jgi:hypothetical protein ELI_2569
MKIWIIDHYSVPVKYYPLARNTNFAKNLMKMGHEVTIFAASTVHNSTINLIEDNSEYKEIVDDGVKYVLVHCHQYSGNGLKRVLNMLEFARKLEPVCEQFSKPEVILSTSMTLQACKKGIQLGKKYACKTIAQITDLWPESLVAYKIVSNKNPITKILRKIEKWIYVNADQIVFSMGGAYDYIIEQQWQSLIPRTKVHYINNGVDLQQFDYNKEEYQINDKDLVDSEAFKVVYVGSIRNANNLSLMLDAAKLVKNKRVRFLFWGEGDQLETLKERTVAERINNVRFKGRAEKKYIPYITSCADLNVVHSQNSEIMRFGMSMNKFFDCLAAGKPILVDFNSPYNPVIEAGAAIQTEKYSANSIASTIDEIVIMPKEKLEQYGRNAREGVKQYDFIELTKRLLNIMEN